MAINAPTGVGKSAITRAIQLAHPGTVAIVPTNILLDQYTATYSDLNYVKGRDHYECKVEGYTCEERKEAKHKPCTDCPYVSCRVAARQGASTVFNPISYFYFQDPKADPPDVLVVDEAHKLPELLMLLTGCSFRKGYYDYPSDISNEIEMAQWLRDLLPKLYVKVSKQRASGLPTEAKATQQQIEKVQNTLDTLTKNPQNIVFFKRIEKYKGRDEEYLVVSPIEPPRWMLERLLACKTLVLMSATLMESDIKAMGLTDYKYLDVPSPIPKASREVLYRPPGVVMGYETPPAVVADWIKQQISDFPDRNTLVHVSYSWQKKLKPFFPEALTNKPETKEAVLKKFKQKGGVWLAAGCSEGVDLPGDECRLVLIPIVSMPYPSDPIISKQLAKPGGRLRYELDALKTVIQQCGRGVRGLDDWATTVVGDAKFPRLMGANAKHVPKSFKEAIQWRGSTTKK